MILAIVVTAILTYLFSEAVGFAIHWVAHRPWSGRMFRHHMVHHAKDYPPNRFMTDKYLVGLKESFIWYFAPAFVLMNLTAWLLLAWPLALTFSLITIGVSVFNDLVHDSFHVENHWMTQFRWHSRTRELHRIHHVNVKKNLGMYLTIYDRIFGSFRSS
jgi:sterol desaturase/sphingolipid hydroxylase (fatty acid hydroxylase superfamily)